MRVEQVTDWQAVALRYLALRGQSDGTLLERDAAPHKESRRGSANLQPLKRTLLTRRRGVWAPEPQRPRTV